MRLILGFSYGAQVLMVKKELENVPELANENWDRFLPKFKKYVLLCMQFFFISFHLILC